MEKCITPPPKQAHAGVKTRVHIIRCKGSLEKERVLGGNEIIPIHSVKSVFLGMCTDRQNTAACYGDGLEEGGLPWSTQ